MARNNSNNEKTVKSTLNIMSSDLWTIDNLSRYSNYKDIAMIPDGFVLDDFRDHFEANYIEEIPLEEKYMYSPSLFSEYYYGTPDLDWLVMYFAKIPSLFEFNTPTIRVLSKTGLADLNKLMIEYKQEVFDSKNNPPAYEEIDAVELTEKAYL
jgi:hypothetical protein